MSIDLDVLTKQIAEIREKRRAQGKRTTEATQELFELGPAYDWQKDPKNYRDEDHDHGIPINRCCHCGFKYVGWREAAPFCNICHLAHVGKSIIEPGQRIWIQSHVRIPEGMTEDEFVIREKKRQADRAYEEKKSTPIESNFKRAIDLA